jgi:hypothetical protein
MNTNQKTATNRNFLSVNANEPVNVFRLFGFGLLISFFLRLVQFYEAHYAYFAPVKHYKTLVG